MKRLELESKRSSNNLKKRMELETEREKELAMQQAYDKSELEGAKKLKVEHEAAAKKLKEDHHKAAMLLKKEREEKIQ